MERACSSDDDLAWSNASSDNSSSGDGLSNMKSKKHDHEFESKNYDNDKLCNGLEDKSQKNKSKKRKRDEDLSDIDALPAKKKMIKTEPESDRDKSESEEIAQSDSFVNLRVKQENAPVECDEIRSKKKKHRKIKEGSINESHLLDDTEDSHNTTVDEYVAEKTKKKKKHKKHNKEESRNGLELSNYADENYNTTSQEPEENKSKKKKKYKTNKEESIQDSELLDNTEDDFNKTVKEPVEDETRKKKKKRKSEHNSDLEEDGDTSTSKKSFKRIVNNENSDENEQECDKIDNEDRSTVASSTFLENMPKRNKMDVDSHINDMSAITSTVSKKTTRISDRLKFEDDEIINSIINGPELDSNILSSKEVKTFLNSDTSLVPVKSFTTFNADNDDIWILKCPSEISINDFKDFNLILDGKSKFKINGQIYDGNIDESDCKVPIVTYSKKKAFLKNLSVLKTITFRKRIPVPHIQDDSVITSTQTSFIPLPDTKCRHPLFGTNYKKAVKVSKIVLERLAESELQPELEEEVIKKKRKKHKKEKNIEKLSKVEHVKEEPEEHSIPEESTKKKKKRKHKIEEDSDTKPAKRIKLEQNPEAWESEKAIEDNLFNF